MSEQLNGCAAACASPERCAPCKPCKSAETAPTRMLWWLSSGRPGLPACIPAVHTYGRGLDCADGLMRTAEPTCEPPNQPRCAKVQRKPAPGRPSCRPGWPCSPLAFCPLPSPDPSGKPQLAGSWCFAVRAAPRCAAVHFTAAVLLASFRYQGHESSYFRTLGRLAGPDWYQARLETKHCNSC